VTGSQYRRSGAEKVSAGLPADAGTFAETVAGSSEFEPHPVYVMDVCPDGQGLPRDRDRQHLLRLVVRLRSGTGGRGRGRRCEGPNIMSRHG